MKKVQYFQTETFVQNVLDALNLQNETSAAVDGLRQLIEDTLQTRLLAVLFAGLSERDLALFRQIQVDHPELEDLDVFMMMLHNVDGLDLLLEKEINELQVELIDLARQTYLARKSFSDDIA